MSETPELIDVVYAMSNASLPVGGGQVPVRKGGHWPADDPIVTAYPDLFSPDPRWGLNYTREPKGYDAPPYERPVEQATAAPGEKRKASRG